MCHLTKGLEYITEINEETWGYSESVQRVQTVVGPQSGDLYMLEIISDGTNSFTVVSRENLAGQRQWAKQVGGIYGTPTIRSFCTAAAEDFM